MQSTTANLHCGVKTRVDFEVVWILKMTEDNSVSNTDFERCYCFTGYLSHVPGFSEGEVTTSVAVLRLTKELDRLASLGEFLEWLVADPFLTTFCSGDANQGK